METRVAPSWITHEMRHYRRMSVMWKFATVFEFLGVIGYLYIGSGGTFQNVAAALVIFGSIGLARLQSWPRAKVFEYAYFALGAAIVRYEVDPERPDTTLTEADLQVSANLLEGMRALKGRQG